MVALTDNNHEKKQMKAHPAIQRDYQYGFSADELAQWLAKHMLWLFPDYIWLLEK